MSPSLRVSVVVVTYQRPECVQACLDHLRRQSVPPHEIFLIDASLDGQTAAVADNYPEVTYISYPEGRGHMTSSRNRGWMVAGGDIVAFIDDDAYAETGWLQALVEPYSDPTVGAVGGRALTPGASTPAQDVPVGRLLPNGRLTGNFDADPGRIIDADHMIGCNMSFRRTVLEELGSLFDCYGGPEQREDTDAAFATRKLGYRVVFQPAAAVLHVGAPHIKGQRFDVRYAYYAAHNHMVLLRRYAGWRSPTTYRYLGTVVTTEGSSAVRSVLGAFVRLAVQVAGTVTGALNPSVEQRPPRRDELKGYGHSTVAGSDR